MTCDVLDRIKNKTTQIFYSFLFDKMPLEFKGLSLDMLPHISCVFTVEIPVKNVEGVN